jgi:inosine/xanthosine triphosphatase
MISAVAGTFNVLHDGHRKLIRKAFDVGDSVFIGITTDEMANSRRSKILPLNARKNELTRFLSEFHKPWLIMEIDDIYGPREVMDEVDVLIVSEETSDNGDLLNDERISRGVRPLKIHVIPLVKAYDGSKISSTSILNGSYAKNGKVGEIDIVVGSSNNVKVEAVRSVMERIFGNIRLTSVDAESGVPPQPFEDDTRKGAINRAINSIGDHELSVGIEAGVFETEDGLYDFQYCAILDDKGELTIGVGSGFRYPDDISELVRNGHTVGEAVKIIHGDTDIGKKQGAVGLLSTGLIDRKMLTEQSVTAAMIPRMRRLKE